MKINVHHTDITYILNKTRVNCIVLTHCSALIAATTCQICEQLLKLYEKILAFFVDTVYILLQLYIDQFLTFVNRTCKLWHSIRFCCSLVYYVCKSPCVCRWLMLTL